MYHTLITIETIADGNVISAYIFFNHVPTYVLVNRYDISRPCFEEVPDDTEREEWKRISQHS